MIRIIFTLVSVQLKKFFRQPAILFWAIAFPVVITWVLGVAFDHNGKTESLKIGLVGVLPNNSPLSDVTQVQWIPVSSENDIRKALREGAFSVYMTTPETYPVVHYDPKNADAKLTYLSLAKQLSDRQGCSDLQKEPITQKGSRYIDFLLPGMAALSVMNSCIWGIGWGIIEMRMKKMLRRMMATPIPKVTFPISQFISRYVVSLAELLVLYGFAHFYFGTSIQGSIWGLIAIITAGNFAFGGIALMVGSRTDNTTVGNGLINAVTLPMMVLSGVFFSYRNFPTWASGVIQYLPLTLIADSFRLIFNEPVGFSAVALPVSILVVTGIITTTMGLRMFKWH